MSSLKKYRMAETGVLHLRDASDELMYADGADGKPDPTKPMRVHLYGPGSKQYARALNERQNHNVDLLKRKGRTKESAEEAVRINAEFLCGCTQSFENIESDSGATGETLWMETYRDQGLSFIRDQVAAFLNETANFSKPSTTSSVSTSDKAPG